MKRLGIIACTLLFIGAGCTGVQNETSRQNSRSAPAVETTSKPAFDIKLFVPANAENITVQDIDFEGDGVVEKILRFKSFDVAKNSKFDRSNYHVRVFVYKNGSWSIIKDDSMPINNAIATGWYLIVEPFQLPGTNRQALLVEKQNDGTGAIYTYYVFGKENGEFSDYPLMKGYLNESLVTKEEKNNACYARFYGVSTTTLGLKEGYGLFCNGESHRFGTEVRSFSIQHDYNAQSGTFTSRVLNK